MLIGMAARKQMTLNQAFGIALKRFRAERGLTQEELAHGADLALTSVGRMEIGAQGIRLDTAMRLARALGISGATLVSECERIMKRVPSPTVDPAKSRVSQ